MTATVLPRSFYRRDPLEVAPELLNKVVRHRHAAGRIVEVEAYRGADDPASHTHRGPTARNATMFGPAGHLYVYFSYGLHWCANAVCDDEGVGAAVLLRALAPLRGLGAMRRRRGARPDRQLCSGPARLTQALGVDGDLDGSDLTRGPVRIVDDGTPPPAEPAVTTRVGISLATDRPWRWLVPGDPHVSAGRPSHRPVSP